MPAGSKKDSPEDIAIKQKARDLGIKFAPRLGISKVQKLIDDHLQMQDAIALNTPITSPSSEETPKTMNTETVVSAAPPANPVLPPDTLEKLKLSPTQFKKKQAAEEKQNAGKLVRCRITCMNPTKKNWTGEIISVGSAKVGTYKKFIPYNTDDPYHVPYIIYQYLKERQCRVGTTQRLPNGQEVNRYKLINEFAIELLEPLTQSEMKELAQRQAMASGTSLN